MRTEHTMVEGEQLIEYNKLIAEFMKHYTYDKLNKLYVSLRMNKNDENELKYHSSWDWLIPVCKKICDIATNQANRPTINHVSKLDWIETEISIEMREYNIERVFLKTVEFIELYNKQ